MQSPKKVMKFCSLALKNIFSNQAASLTMCHHTFLSHDYASTPISNIEQIY